MSTPARLVAIGIYDNKGTLRRKIDVREDGTFEPFDVKANEMVYSILDLGDGSKPSIAPWETRHRPVMIENRWAPFTDDEIDSILHGLNADLPSSDGLTRAALIGETHRELTRRKTGAT